MNEIDMHESVTDNKSKNGLFTYYGASASIDGLDVKQTRVRFSAMAGGVC